MRRFHLRETFQHIRRDLRFLARNPRQRGQLRDKPALIPRAVDELIRRHGIVNTGRTIAHDVVYHGTVFKKGEIIILPNALVGLDPGLFPDPLTVDFNRPNSGQHAAFGSGIHRCPGANMARLEIRVILDEWLRIIPNFDLAPDEPFTFAPGTVNGVSKLKLVWNTSS